jgi:hypothetical protein
MIDDLTSNPVSKTHQSCPHPQPLCLDAHKREETSRSMRRSQAWERGARARGEGGVRATWGFDRKRRVCEAKLL